MPDTNASSRGFNAALSRKLFRFRPEKSLFDGPFWTLTATLALLMMPSCATTHATLDIVAPPTATAGTPFTITVTAFYGGQVDTVINSPIIFTSSDPAAVLPLYFTFSPADAGSYTWTDGVTLMTPGRQTISASIKNATGINGTAYVTVSTASSADKE